MIQFQENTWTDSRLKGQSDPLSWDPSSYCRGSKKYNCRRLSLKSKIYRKRYQFNQKIIASQSACKVQILGSHKLNGHTHFWLYPPKIIKITFSFPEFAQACKKSVQPKTQLETAIFDHTHQENFWSIFNLCEFASTCKKSSISWIFSGDMVD